MTSFTVKQADRAVAKPWGGFLYLEFLLPSGAYFSIFVGLLLGVQAVCLYELAERQAAGERVRVWSLRFIYGSVSVGIRLPSNTRQIKKLRRP